MTIALPRLSLAALQPLGRALMLPIAVLPVAGLLLRLGQSDMLNIAFMAAAGDAIFHNLGLLFALGVAVGFAKDGNGAAGLAGVVCFLVATQGAEALIAPPAEIGAGLGGESRALAVAAFKSAAIFRLGVPLGIISGLIAGAAYNRFGAIRLPDMLAFFGGRRFVPILCGLVGLGLAYVFGAAWTTLSVGVDAASRAIVAAGPLGLFVFGVMNRVLIVTGLHHILNNVVWFIVGDFHGATGDLGRFFAGDPTAGAFMAGFFPVMMFGLPAACLAMYRTARPERRPEVGGLLLSLALTSVLTGVTEPIEFSFMFLAPVLFGLHALMTGAAMVIMDALGVKLGFGFSAGLFDYALNFGKATRPLLLLPVGLAYFALYYVVFRTFILRFDLKTPGREAPDAMKSRVAPAAGSRVEGFIDALGGAANLVSVDACTTRLRLVVSDQGAIDEAALKALGARGVIRPSARDLQVVIGPTADLLAREIKEALAAPSRPAIQPAAHGGLNPAAILRALGGATNIAALSAVSSRLRVALHDESQLDAPALAALPLRGVARPRPGVFHLIVGPTADDLALKLKASMT